MNAKVYSHIDFHKGILGINMMWGVQNSKMVSMSLLMSFYGLASCQSMSVYCSNSVFLSQLIIKVKYAI